LRLSASLPAIARRTPEAWGLTNFSQVFDSLEPI
jgi:hypothetical protein